MCIPGLHLSLGIFDRLWNLLSDDCCALDFRLAGLKPADGSVGGEEFTRYQVALQKRSSMLLGIETQENYVKVIEDMATYFTLTSPAANTYVTQLQNEATAAKSKIGNMVKHGYLLTVTIHVQSYDRQRN